MNESVKILAVDDNPSILESMPFIFPGPRYEVKTAPNGYSALAGLGDANQSPYDVIIVDQTMPQMTGVELVQIIKERGIAGKIVVLSAHLSPEVREAYQRMNVHTLLSKPFDIQELRLAVEQLAA